MERVVDDPVERAALAERTGAIACDMESGVLASTGRLRGVVRAVADGPERPLGALAQGAKADGSVAWSAVLRAFLREPVQSARSARNARRGLAALSRRRWRRARVAKRVLIAAPRSFCAGVVRAIDIVEKLLDTHGPPVYVRHQIVHNVHVVRDLESRGAVFVETEQEVPEGALVVLSAHGVAPSVYRMCAERNLEVIDATCPLVSKVHAEARRYAGRGLKIALVGHARHEEVVGTMGEAPDSISAWSRPSTTSPSSTSTRDSRSRTLPRRRSRWTTPARSSTRSASVSRIWSGRRPRISATRRRTARTRSRRSASRRPSSSSSGSKTSSNANRLVEVARSCGADAFLVDDDSDLDPAWLAGHEVVGLTAGASSPDSLVTRVADRLAEHGYAEREEVELTREDVYFRLPAALR